MNDETIDRDDFVYDESINEKIEKIIKNYINV